MSKDLGICLERPSALDRASGRPLWGDMGMVLRRTLQHYGLDVDTQAIVTYVLPDPKVTGERIALVKPQIARIQQELAGVRKILACGAMSLAAVQGLDSIPTKYAKKRGRGQMTTWGDPPKFVVPSYSLQMVFAENDYYRDLCFDVQKIVSQDAPHPVPDIEVIVVRTVDELRAWLDRISSASIIGADLETEGFSAVTDRIESIGLGVLYREGIKGLTVIIPQDLLYGDQSQYVRGLLLHFLGPRSPYTGVVVWQNLGFDAKFLKVYLGDWAFHPHTSDTLLQSYSLDERPIGRFGVHSLKDMCRFRFDVEDYAFDWDAWRATPQEQRDYDTLYKYHALDCVYTAKMYEVFTEEMSTEPGLDGLVRDLLVPGAQALAKVTLHGMLIDQDYLRAYREKLLALIKERDEELREFAEGHGVENFLPSSPQQVADFIFGTLGLPMPQVKSKDRKVGEWSTAKIILDKVRRDANEAQRSFIDALLAYRLYSRTLNAYVDNLLAMAGPDGRIRPEIFIAGTATGRLSCARPALQQVPVHVAGDVRRAFIAPDGHSLAELDFQALEVRAFAWISQEPTLIDAFKRGVDVHRDVAARFFGKKPEDVSSHERFLAKSLVFGCLYGRSAQAIAEGREMDTIVEMGGSAWSIKQTEEFQQAFLDSMPKVKEWLTTYKRECLAQQYTTMPFGRRRRFPLVLYHTRNEIERQICNCPIQGMASDICFSAVIRLVNELPEGASVALTVHDSVLLQVRDELLPSVIRQARQIMEHPPNPPIDDRVPWAVSVKTGKNWSEMMEWNNG